MAGHNGRELKIDWDAVTLKGVRSKTVSMSNEMVDVTTDDDNGWRTVLAVPGLKSVEVTVEGVVTDEILIAEFYKAATTGEALKVTLPSSLATPGNLSGTFHLSSFEESGSHDGDVLFSATFMSSGEVTYTASSA